MKKFFKFVIKIISVLILSLVIINIAVIAYSSVYIKKEDKLTDNYDCILVLGTSVNGKEPGALLKDRLDTAIRLYNCKQSRYVVMSGDGIDKYYNEPKAMKDYAIKQGLEDRIIIMDEGGLSTYESMYRAKELIGVRKPLIVTQKYHLFRSVFAARCLGMDAAGVAAEKTAQDYPSALYRHTREFFARVKDFIFVFIRPEPNYMDDVEIK